MNGMKVCRIENEGNDELKCVIFLRDLWETRVRLVLMENIHLGYI